MRRGSASRCFGPAVSDGFPHAYLSVPVGVPWHIGGAPHERSTSTPDQGSLFVSSWFFPPDTPLSERNRSIPEDFWGSSSAEDDANVVRPSCKKEDGIDSSAEGGDSRCEGSLSLLPVDRYSERQRPG